MKFKEVETALGHRRAMLIKWPTISQNEKFLTTVTDQQWINFLNIIIDDTTEREALETMSRLANSYNSWKIIFDKSKFFVDIRLNAIDNMTEIANNFDDLFQLAINVKFGTHLLKKVVIKIEEHITTFDQAVKFFDFYRYYLVDEQSSKILENTYQKMRQLAITVKECIQVLDRTKSDDNIDIIIDQITNCAQIGADFNDWEKLFNKHHTIPDIAHLSAINMLKSVRTAFDFASIYESKAHLLLDVDDIRQRIGDSHHFEYMLSFCQSKCTELLPNKEIYNKVLELSSWYYEYMSILVCVNDLEIREKVLEKACNKESNIKNWIQLYREANKKGLEIETYKTLIISKINEFELNLVEWQDYYSYNRDSPELASLFTDKMREIANN